MTEKTALIQPDRGQPATSLHLVTKDGFAAFARVLAESQRAALAAQQFEGAPGETAILPAADSTGTWSAIAGVKDPASLGTWCLAPLAEMLPAGTYRVAQGAKGQGGPLAKALFGWLSAHYRFTRYQAEPKPEKRRVLLTAEVAAIDPALAEMAATALVRDLVNTPAEDMGPAALEAAAARLAKAHGASIRVTSGEALQRDYPLVHAVGRAAARDRAPRVLELEWGDPANPRLAIVGKGVCFDTGGLDLKPSSAMLLMKKDMGGAAHALGLAALVMGAGLKVHLQVLVPAVENSVAGSAMRPGDVFCARGGTSVEITNTDAEGRLILADALVKATEGAPDLIVDFATLTGAARVALGPDLPGLMARRDETAHALEMAGLAVDDPVWRLPLPDAYREYLKSDIADMINAPSNGFAGASVAGLFLDKFVGEGIDWAHFDTFAWRPAGKPGRPKGGEALGLRATFAMLRARYAA